MIVKLLFNVLLLKFLFKVLAGFVFMIKLFRCDGKSQPQWVFFLAFRPVSRCGDVMRVVPILARLDCGFPGGLI